VRHTYRSQCGTRVVRLHTLAFVPSLAQRGRLVWLGVAATSNAGMRVIPLSLLTRFGLTLIPDGKRAPMTPNAERSAQMQTLTTLLDSLAAGTIKPLVAERVPLAEAARAHELLERGGHAGKVVLVPST
jgi:NADPH:quinone reductase-like Zn-dependent oxidoreductase